MTVDNSLGAGKYELQNSNVKRSDGMQRPSQFIGHSTAELMNWILCVNLENSQKPDLLST